MFLAIFRCLLGHFLCPVGNMMGENQVTGKERMGCPRAFTTSEYLI